MLKHLQIKNYALIEGLEMSPSENLNIITGETGAGKSIMLGAVGLLLGNRADSKVLLNKEKKCVIEGEFDLEAYRLEALFEHEDLDYEPRTILRRELSPGGKSRAFINDTPVNLEVLKAVGSRLMDVHSQNDTLLLGKNIFQLQLIDAYAQNQALLDQYRTAYQSYQIAEKELRDLESEINRFNEESDYVNFLYDELKKADLQENEQESLEADLKVLENAEEVKSALLEAASLLSEQEYSALEGIRQAKTSLSRLVAISAKFGALHDRIDSLFIELQDIAAEIEKNEQLVEVDPAKTDYTRERLGLIYQLQQKHKVPDLEALLKVQQDLEEKVGRFHDLDETLSRARQKLELSEKEVQDSGENLTRSRLAILDELSATLTSLLGDVGMPEARIEIKRTEIKPSSNGLDDIRILFSANKGVSPQELKEVASGGEFSRLMFCLKYVMASRTSLPTVIFDEIDSGISGEIAFKMGTMMKKMAHNHQVITISHLPQIAARGNKHYFVFKDNSQATTISLIKVLDEQERVVEIAKMIGGNNPSPVAYENAKELIYN